MNLKEIKVAGFKSFADKTSIKFEDGVTCIVGPNGCGKSNVADAVRWVLGEQSAKVLRGTSMQDVIFNGTEARRQLSYCEVTLVFDNSTRLFDVDYSEVAMTRRLYRSGESEYLLNMQPCRLKEIVALLHDVGIGKEGYSIIGQNRVDLIMNAKPEDRRAVFEEATGVMKFKLQRREIENKLQNARDNLTVFIQRMDEAEKQLRPLEQQAETAKKYRGYYEDLRHEEVNTYLLRYENFTEETGRHRKKIEEAERELSGVEARLAEVDNEETDARGQVERNDAVLRDLNDNLRLYEVGMEHKTGEAKVLSARIESYKRELAAASETVDYSVRRTKTIDGLVAEGEKKLGKMRERSAEIGRESAELTMKLREAEARITAYEKLSVEKRASELSSVENLADLRANAGSLAAKRDAAQDRAAEVRAAIEKAQTRRTEYVRQKEECLKEKALCEAFLNKKNDEESALASEISDLANSERRISQEIVEANSSIASYKNNLELYKSLKNQFEGYRDSVRRLQLEGQKNPEVGRRIKGAIADIVHTDKKYEVAIETAFGAAMQNLVTATQDDARWLVEYLKRTGWGVVTFLPVDGMRSRVNSAEVRSALRESGAMGLADELVKYDPYYSSVVTNLLGNTLIVDTIASATNISKRYPHAFRIVTLDGDTIATSGAITGGSRRKESGHLFAGERRIKECEDEIAKKTAVIEKLKGALESCGKDLDEARAAYEAFRIKVQEQTASFAALSEKELAIVSLIADADKDIADFTALLAQLTRKADELESEVLSSAENEELLSRIRSEAAKEAGEREVEIGKLKENRDALSESLHALEVEGATLRSTLASDEDNLARLKQEKQDLLLKVEETRSSIAGTEKQIEALKRDEEKAALTEEEQEAVGILRKKLAAADEEKKAVYERQTLLAEEKRKLLARQMTLSEKKHQSELEISKAETLLENMQQRMEEEYQLTYETALEYRDPEYDLSQAANNIANLKRKITALGPINPRAEEDYAALFERYSDMQTQKDDLDKGIMDLTTVLEELKTEMQRKFDEGFNEINKNFTQIFKELFGGGKAEMQLDYTDCADPLDAGVEIIACPPGKKLAKISLLSGGERALTAIAILFAILKTNPMPFCILDEIEAALDEANVDRFAKYLKKFSQDTQFIVITHRKPTMNQADSLFGVTMEEKGVSKIVSVKLSEVESRLGGDTVM